MRVVLSYDVEVRVLRFERTLRHVAHVGARFTVVTSPLLDLILRDLKYTQVLRQIFHCKTVLWWQIFDLLHGEHASIQLSEYFAEFDIVEFLY